MCKADGGVVRIGSGVQEEWVWCSTSTSGSGASGLGLWCRPATAPTRSNLPATRPAPALVMAGEVGPTGLALAKVSMVTMVVASMVGLIGVEGGLSPPDSSRDGTDFRHFPATTDERGEKLFPFFILSLLTQLTQMTQLLVHGSEWS